MSKSTCSVAECERVSQSRTWCSMHYRRWMRHGDPLHRERSANGEHLEWLRSAVTSPGEACILWPFRAADSKGYGRIQFGGKDRYATHAALIISGNPRPDAPGDRALHSCDNPPCVNPRHLRWGTQRENLQEMAERGRSCHGEARPNHKLTEEQVNEIRNTTYWPRGSKAQLARDLGVHTSTISMILNGKNWKRSAS